MWRLAERRPNEQVFALAVVVGQMGGAEIGGAADIGEADGVQAVGGEKLGGDGADAADEGGGFWLGAIGAADRYAEGAGGDFILGEGDAAFVAFEVGHGGGIPEYFPILRIGAERGKGDLGAAARGQIRWCRNGVLVERPQRNSIRHPCDGECDQVDCIRPMLAMTATGCVTPRSFQTHSDASKWPT